MNAHDEDGAKHLLRQALPPVEGDAGPEHDLWPAMLRRLDAEPAAPAFSGCDSGLSLLPLTRGAFYPQERRIR